MPGVSRDAESLTKGRPLSAQRVAHAALIAAGYAALTLVFQPISFYAVQLRVSEALTVLPILTPSAVPGLFIGVLIANAVGSPFGLVDIVLGSLLTLLAAVLTRHFRARPLVALLWPVAVNAFGVAAYIQLLMRLPSFTVAGVQVPPYWGAVITIAAGEAVAVFCLGYPLLVVLRRFGRRLFE